MKKIIEKRFCDVCKKEINQDNPGILSVNVPVIFYTEQTEGRETTPYLVYEEMDLCLAHYERVFPLRARGAQGINEYFFEE